jgi:hypothetical protein
MKLEIENGDVIHSAHFNRLNDQCSELITNLVEKYYDSLTTESGRDYIKFSYCLDDSSGVVVAQGDVTITAESEDDITILRRIRFENMCKGQIWTLFISNDLLERST